MQDEIIKEIDKKALEIDKKAMEIISLLEAYQDENAEQLELKKHIYVDGSGFNGSKCSYCIATSKNKFKIEYINENYSNNEMEYMALIMALIKASSGSTIYSDSELVINQISGEYKVTKNHLRMAHLIARTLTIQKHIILKWVPRGFNIAGLIFDEKKKNKA